ncbi:MAG: serine/threonine protein kinase [Deltaproteobacteria bacterium]|nr:serine/threonine protein kinase [Deltaproteobacteria bacterium]
MGTTLESLTKLPRPFGPFTLIRLIAQGGMGQVFLALRPVEEEPTDEVCVVKTVRTDLREDREAIGRFLDEARIIQLLDHPCICHTLDAGVIDRTYFLALEFISGRNFRDIQTRAQKLSRQVPDEVIFHGMVQMLEALAYAHGFADAKTGVSLGVVHRDVSPHNLMLGFDGHVKLIDFGLAAHTLKRELTRPGIMVGKLRYNAPEQVRDRALDGRSDVYSAGVMLYELLVGERFYEGLSEEDIWRVAMKGTFKPRGYSGLSRTVRSVLDLALAPEPEERFPTAAHMRDAVIELGRTRGVGDGRRVAARFMSELFAEERQGERDMILQATGLAEARTRLFEVPALSDEPSASGSASSVGRSHVVSPAQVRGRLADLLSEEFDPDAQTMLPHAPEISDADDSGSASGAFERVALDRSAPERTDATKLARSMSGRMGNADTVVRSASGAPEPTGPRSGQRTGATATRPNVDENLPSARSGAAAPQKVPRVTAEVRRREPPTQANARAPWAAALIVLTLLAIAAAGTVVWLLVKKEGGSGVRVVEVPADAAVAVVEKDPPDTVGAVDAPIVDAGSETAAATDAGAPATVLDAGEPVMDTGSEPSPVDEEERARLAAAKAERLKAKQAEQAAREQAAKEKAERDKAARDKAERDRMAREAAERERTRPPARELKTLKEQVAYLKEFCLQRVGCAGPAVDQAKRFATLSPDETKAFLAEINRCIQKCQR